MIYEFEGKTEREAIDIAVAKLGLEKDQFDVEILEIQKNSLFKKIVWVFPKKQKKSSCFFLKMLAGLIKCFKNSQMFEKMSGTKSKIGGYDAYVINTLTNTGKYFITYIFKADDGKIHYASIEGDKDTVTKMIPLLEESWSLKK